MPGKEEETDKEKRQREKAWPSFSGKGLSVNKFPP
jgi:hypothetical protein